MDTVQFDVPTEDPNAGQTRYWVVGCFDSLDGHFEPIDVLTVEDPADDVSLCEQTRIRRALS